ncbi:hypothetical protein [Acidianus brierleyi]|uniref:hypothetical protein n=1 Tax=Acidianus brierleyi TaxID=41673 RepID=UPI0013A5488D|nr:hypothetical protein [Acidianus brierleyi]
MRYITQIKSYLLKTHEDISQIPLDKYPETFLKIEYPNEYMNLNRRKIHNNPYFLLK